MYIRIGRPRSSTNRTTVFKQAIADGVALDVPDDIIDKEIEKNFWYLEYRTYKRTSF